MDMDLRVIFSLFDLLGDIKKTYNSFKKKPENKSPQRRSFWI